jgi:hypothetical protein
VNDRQFARALAAVADFNARPPKTREQIDAERREAHRRDPKHIKALAKRRKAKRGGPR